MHRVHLICGSSGSGKDTLVQEFIKRNTEYSQIISYTTRKPRYDGENTHIFITEDEVEQYRNQMIAYTFYNNHHYFATVDQLRKHNFYVVDPKGVEYLKTRAQELRLTDIDIIPIHIQVSLPRRFTRMRKRGDSYVNTIKRLVNDHKEFKNFRSEFVIENKNFKEALSDLDFLVTSFENFDCKFGI